MAINIESSPGAERFAALERWVERDPERLGGVPVFRGTRVPVKSLFDHLQAGDPLDTFLEDFPGVSSAQAHAVLQLAADQLLKQAANR